MRSRRVSREHALAPHRVWLLAVLAVLALVAVLAARGPVWAQRLYHPLRYEAEIARAAKANGVDPYLVCAVINAESGFDPKRVSQAGAVGLMQVMPATATEVAGALGISRDRLDLTDPATNIAIGTRHLADLLARYDDTATALAAYNAGAGTVGRWMAEEGTETLTKARYPETAAYVERVLAERDRYARLYPDAFAGVR
ncbi:lytic transglycosylase domain-containing protein [Coriobacteriia bacterium Es71-Z0120]|uniref:lytic transglycosylase domain-containing protein n=1 Tax=Parvivirga hydrogeniphila TaxID=2939460 RepID=UPI002260C3E8|nr:lytic transglycosylase domain-containing protein [Parvivirga hydrogeniphila]MCL4078860.1 lytic transglycosylase domain-containing protein [Parvivirga hydrogeniphila]